jgi:predicted anti-sigma-YlaC factor YlaD
MIDHVQFEELISEYLDGGLARPVRRNFAEHLLACRPCHLLFNDVREGLDACHQLKESQMREIALFTEVEQRILNATTAGEMLSCRTLDALISDYFEGIIEQSYDDIFREHFAICAGCRRLVEGVRQSLEEPDEVEVPEELYGRILAATSGRRR